MRKKYKTTLDKMRKKAISFKEILSRNIIITTAAVMLLFVILPYFLEQFAPKLWEYVAENITINEIEDMTEDDPLIESIAAAVGNVMLELKIFMIRGFRFLFLLIVIIMLLYLFIYLILSLIMNHEVGGKAILVSIIISFGISFGIAYMIMFNSKDVMTLMIDFAENSEMVSESYEFDNPLGVIALAVDLLYGIYYGFALLFIVNFIVVSVFQNSLKN